MVSSEQLWLDGNKGDDCVMDPGDHASPKNEMTAIRPTSRPLFDERYLQVAAEVRANAWRHRWRDLAAMLLVLLIMALGAVPPIIVVGQIAVLVVQGPTSGLLDRGSGP